MAPHAEGTNSSESSVGPTTHSTTSSKPELFTVQSPNVKYTDSDITSKYTYRTTEVNVNDGKYVASPKEKLYDFKTERNVGKVGLMLVGLGGNNGTTVTAGILANRQGLSWDTRVGPRASN